MLPRSALRAAVAAGAIGWAAAARADEEPPPRRSEIAAVLRSLAVAPDWRGHGFGWLLADHAVMRARDRGARRLYLLTETASDFFAEKFGFRAIDRATVDTAVMSTATFRESARAAVAKRLDL